MNILFSEKLGDRDGLGDQAQDAIGIRLVVGNSLKEFSLVGRQEKASADMEALPTLADTPAAASLTIRDCPSLLSAAAKWYGNG